MYNKNIMNAMIFHTKQTIQLLKKCKTNNTKIYEWYNMAKDGVLIIE